MNGLSMNGITPQVNELKRVQYLLFFFVCSKEARKLYGIRHEDRAPSKHNKHLLLI